jgi:AraC family ethanolamine operon transcriptional activator
MRVRSSAREPPAGVTERSLQRGFQDVVGTTPKAYIQAQRLTNVRRQLRGADPSRTRVADVANEWGFWHLGQFAADYRRHFGERPSETLRRRRLRGEHH